MEKLNHGNVVKFIGLEVHESHIFLLMEYGSGGNMRQLVEARKLTESEIERYVRQLLDALVYMHNQGIVHRDLKCSNLVLKGDVLKIIDFGIAAEIANDDDGSFSDKNLLDSFKGTIFWMAPEVIVQKKYGVKSDIWSMGCCVVEMITCKNPWPNVKSYFEVMEKVGKTDELPDYPSGLGEVLQKVLSETLVKDLTKRSSAKDLVKKLEELVV